MHQFVAAGVCYGVSDPDFELEIKNQRNIKLSRLLKDEGDRIIYEYDFGDGWEHEIVLEKKQPFNAQASLPVCLAGERSCPPEDCGGIWGYENLLQIITDPLHEEYEEMLTWLGDEFRPEKFDVTEVNRVLSRLVR